MKKIIIFFVITIALIVGIYFYANPVNKSILQKETAEKLIEYINTNDSQSIKKMFSDYQIKNDDDMEQDIEKLLNEIGGKIESVGELENSIERMTGEKGRTTYYSFSTDITDVSAKDGEKYLIIFDLVAIDKKYPENVGVDIISLFNENNDELLTIGKV